ncbi:prephenate dehydratase [Bacteriovoracaceae bacterium]|nr:prephenate dehydratase [Bacteriovoracaceae bacterium]
MNNKKIVRVAFQGIKGAYSEQAASNYFSNNQLVTVECNTCADVFFKIDQEQVDYAILPVENSIVGGVGEHLDYIFKEDVIAISEYYLPIQHCLLALPGAKIDQIEKVYSHPVAIGQCKKFLDRNSLISIPAYDTAGSAKMISQQNDPTLGAIASSINVDYYNLKIIAENIQSSSQNITRFLIIVKSNNNTYAVKKEKTSIALVTGHRPGSLLECLKLFSTHNLNMTKIESRPIPENPWEYVFYIDFDGSIDDSNVQDCLEKLKEHSHALKVIGSYPFGLKKKNDMIDVIKAKKSLPDK